MRERTMKNEKAKTWQLILFPFNDAVTNIIMMLMSFVSYLYTGAIGTSVVFISTFLTAMRIWDAVTDPVIGWIIDHTGGRFGKFRPMILLGYGLMLISLGLMFLAAPSIGSESARVALFVVCYIFYIFGYTFQTACSKAGQTCITIDPEQRPIITRANAIINSFVFMLVPAFASNYIAAKYQGFTTEALQEFFLIAMAVAGLFTAFAIAALWTRDVPENWGAGDGKKVSIREYLDIIKNNRPLQLLIVSCASDKVASMCASNTSVTVMLFGIILGNYALNGTMGIIMMIPSIIITLLGTEYAKKKGFKDTMKNFSIANIVLYAFLGVLIMTITPGTVTFSSVNFITILFVVLYILGNGSKTVSTSMNMPMIADCTDYEVTRTGAYAPGIIGTIFSFVDKVVSSLSTTIVGFLLAGIGYTSTLPQPGDAISGEIRMITLACFVIIPIVGWVINVIALRFYSLSHEEMLSIHDQLMEKRGAES